MSQCFLVSNIKYVLLYRIFLQAIKIKKISSLSHSVGGTCCLHHKTDMVHLYYEDASSRLHCNIGKHILNYTVAQQGIPVLIFTTM